MVKRQWVGVKSGRPGEATGNEARTMANDPRDTNPLLAELLICHKAIVAQLAMKLTELEQTPAQANGESSAPSGTVSLADAITKQHGVKWKGECGCCRDRTRTRKAILAAADAQQTKRPRGWFPRGLIRTLRRNYYQRRP